MRDEAYRSFSYDGQTGPVRSFANFGSTRWKQDFFCSDNKVIGAVHSKGRPPLRVH